MKGFVWLLVLMGAFDNFLFSPNSRLQVQTECIDSGLKSHDDRPIYWSDCSPTRCEATTSSGGSIEGLKCSVNNYKEKSPDACREIKDVLWSSQAQQQNRMVQRDACQAKLALIGLYDFHCKEISVTEESLSFAFYLPVCGKQQASSSEAVMVEFNAKNDSIHNHFAIHPVCRVFSYGKSDFSHLPPNELIQVSYHCMGIGLQEKDNEVYYYLSFISFPSGVLLNYTIVYMNENSGSLRLIAAAWLSPSSIHVIFLPVTGVTEYLVQAVGRGFNYSKKLSSSTVEIKGISAFTKVITVKVTPMKWIRGSCESERGPCSPIQVTLHDRSHISFSVHIESHTPGSSLPFWVNAVMVASTLVVMVCAVAASIRIACHLMKKLRGKSSLRTPALPTITFISISPETSRIVRHDLQKNGFIMTDASQSDRLETLFSKHDVILIFVCPLLLESPNWEQFWKCVKFIFTNRPLWPKVRVISLDDGGHGHVKTSDIFLNSFSRMEVLESLKCEFLHLLDQMTYYMPRDYGELLQSLQGESPPAKCRRQGDSVGCRQRDGQNIFDDGSADEIISFITETDAYTVVDHADEEYPQVEVETGVHNPHLHTQQEMSSSTQQGSVSYGVLYTCDSSVSEQNMGICVDDYADFNNAIRPPPEGCDDTFTNTGESQDISDEDNNADDIVERHRDLHETERKSIFH